MLLLIKFGYINEKYEYAQASAYKPTRTESSRKPSMGEESETTRASRKTSTSEIPEGIQIDKKNTQSQMQQEAHEASRKLIKARIKKLLNLKKQGDNVTIPENNSAINRAVQ